MVCAYILPSLFAHGRKNQYFIIAINLLLGWTVFGWILALIWALSEKDPNKKPKVPEIKTEPIKATVSYADEIFKLHVLRQNGIISQQEFERKKAQFL